MKNQFKLMAVLLATTLLTSCYSYTSVVGSGAKGTAQVKQWNHYVLFGLAPVNVSDAKQMAGDSQNYTINTKHTFVNGLLAGITFGIYTPTTTTVTK